MENDSFATPSERLRRLRAPERVEIEGGLTLGVDFYAFDQCVGPTDNPPLGASPIFHVTIDDDHGHDKE